MNTLELESSLPAPVVLDRLRVDAEDWRESRLSSAARQRNLYGFALKLRGRRFRLRVRGAQRNAFAPICEGEVLDAPAGSRVVATLRPPRLTFIAGVLWVGGVVASVILAPWSPPVQSPIEGLIAALVMAVPAALLLAVAYAVTRYLRRDARVWHEEIAALLRRASGVETRSAAPQN